MEVPGKVVRFRPDLDRVQVYVPGKPIDEVARDLGLEDIVKLASNEHPEPPLPEVAAAIAEAAATVHRYPDSSCHQLRLALAAHFGISPDELWIGAGSSELLGCIGLAVGGPGTSALFAWPSFAMYPIGTAVAGAEAVTVPLDAGQAHDLDAMAAAVRDDTTVVYLCNPNNPTGTHLPADRIAGFVDVLSPDVLVALDEAYAEYATAADFASGVDLALDRPNVVVLRTFSKAYGLAGLRIGYAIGQPATLEHLARTQRPFSVTTLAQDAAVASLAHQDDLAERVKQNAVLRDEMEAAFATRQIPHVASQTNFVAFRPWCPPATLIDDLLARGVIVRAVPDGWIRVTVGTAGECLRFLEALDACREAS
jgi:histidinol-phosphate aminotransferase